MKDYKNLDKDIENIIKNIVKKIDIKQTDVVSYSTYDLFKVSINFDFILVVEDIINSKWK